MKSWIVIINHQGNTLELKIEAESYSEARLSAERIYAGCAVKDILEASSK
jgi:hypothetical protein